MAGRKSKQTPLATKILLEDTEDSRGGDAIHQSKGGRRNPSVPSRCGSPLLSADVRSSDDVIALEGTDFQYENAAEWFVNLDKLIKATNLDGRVEAFYSTPNEYVAAKRKDTATNWTLVDGDNADFFPYADGPHKFWTGYFTSRPALKRYIRRGSAFFSAVRQAEALANAGTSNTAASSANAAALELFEEALGVVQHHDAVSGTAKQHTSFDYAKRVSIGEAAAEGVLSRSIETLETASKAASGASSWEICRRLNESVCAATSGVGTVLAEASSRQKKTPFPRRQARA